MGIRPCRLWQETAEELMHQCIACLRTVSATILPSGGNLDLNGETHCRVAPDALHKCDCTSCIPRPIRDESHTVDMVTALFGIPITPAPAIRELC